jgi:hypothetical protein
MSLLDGLHMLCAFCSELLLKPSYISLQLLATRNRLCLSSNHICSLLSLSPCSRFAVCYNALQLCLKPCCMLLCAQQLPLVPCLCLCSIRWCQLILKSKPSHVVQIRYQHGKQAQVANKCVKTNGKMARAEALVGGRSTIPHFLGLFSRCGTQHAEIFVDLPPATGWTRRGSCTSRLERSRSSSSCSFACRSCRNCSLKLSNCA